MSVVRTRVFWITGALVVAIIAVVVVVFVLRGQSPSGDGSATTPTPTPSAVPVQTPAAPVVENGTAPGDDVSDLVVAPVAGLSQALANPSTPVDLSSVADGIALSDLNAEVYDFLRDGLQQVGTPEIVSAVVVSADQKATPNTLVVDVCLDRSGVKTVDTAGKDMSNPDAADRVLQVWTMAATASGWKLTDRTFTDALTC